MALIRCNKCGHVAEVAAGLTGTSLACPACGNETPAYDTVLFVRKVLQQYFALRDELQRLQALQPAAAAPVAPAAAPDTLDLHNTDQLASDAQHAAILDWFQRRQIQVRTNPEAVNTTGFFDEIAVEIGDNYALYGEVIDKIRWGQQKDVPNFSLKLAERSQKDGQAINAFCKRLYDHTFLAKYYYQKPEKIGRGTLQSAPNIRRFFAGEWLEWFALMKLLAFFQERRRAVSCTRNLSVVFPNEDLHELDVFFLVDGATPVCIECKTGEFRQEIDKYLRLKKRLGIDRSQFILCCTGLSDEQAAGLSGMYELSFVSPAGLLPHLSKRF
ncbi:hypothetical protein [Zoogloea sp.]|uniref:hypothetical protein n=1 Tax=Zoogloea sp. TaxID=49181 RepID=UPI0026201891|nr:hypothetical protein [uncultured Zoogloea sp.]MCK6386483.1 DUF1887 family protein [Zoogloea sp.]